MKINAGLFLVVTLLLTPLTAAAADGLAEVEVGESSVHARIGVGDVEAELDLEFEQVVGLTLANLGLSAELIDPADLALADRLPEGVSVAGGFPVLLRIEPPESGGLSFTGVATISLYTHDLLYTAGCPLRIFSAPAGGPFTDVTDWMGAGSYRVRSRKPDFSELLIVSDLRPLADVAALKLSRLEAYLSEHAAAIEAATYDELEWLLGDVRTAYGAGDLVAAIDRAEDFAEAVEAASGEAIPDVWRATRDLVNVAGNLRAGAATLRLSLIQQKLGTS